MLFVINRKPVVRVVLTQNRAEIRISRVFRVFWVLLRRQGGWLEHWGREHGEVPESRQSPCVLATCTPRPVSRHTPQNTWKTRETRLSGWIWVTTTPDNKFLNDYRKIDFSLFWPGDFPSGRLQMSNCMRKSYIKSENKKVLDHIFFNTG